MASRWIAGWASSDPQQLARLFTADATYTDEGVGKVSHGRQGVATWQADTHKLIPDVSGTLQDAFRDGDRMLIQSIYRGHIVGAPHSFAVPMATVLHLRGHRIVSDTDYYNLADLLRQSGLPPTWTPPKG
nr:nuclear transport factor 2 family protein [Allobranchiibius huperziae]